MNRSFFIFILAWIMISCNDEHVDPDKYIYPVSLHASRYDEGIQLRWSSALALYNSLWLPGGVQGDHIELQHSPDDTLNFKVIHQEKAGFDAIFYFPVEASGSHHFFRIVVTAKNVRPYISKPLHVQFRKNPAIKSVIEYPNHASLVLGNFSSDGSGILYSRSIDHFIDNPAFSGNAAINLTIPGDTEVPIVYNALAPLWSPDGSLMVYEINSSDPQYLNYTNLGMYMSDTDSTVELTSGNHYFSRPVWHPDGKSIFFLSPNMSDNSFYDIYTYDLESGDYNRTFPNSGIKTGNSRLAIAPDGEMIAIAGFTDLYYYQIFQLDPSNGQASPLIPSIWEDRQPVFSPDGKYLAFLSNRTGLYEIWVLDLSDHAVHQVTGNERAYIDGDLAWSPDSDHIYFFASRYERYGIYFVDLNMD